MNDKFYVLLFHTLNNYFEKNKKPFNVTEGLYYLKNYILENKGNKHLYLDTSGEGYFALEIVRDLLKILALNTDQVTVITNIEMRDFCKPYTTEVVWTSMCNWQNYFKKLPNLNWKDIKLTRHFLSLCNRPSTTRAIYTKQLLDNYTDKALISFASGTYSIPMYIRKILQPYNLPISLDYKRKLNSKISDIRTFTNMVPPHYFFECIANICFETIEPYILTKYEKPLPDRTKYQIKLTEKTFKCFAYHQIPFFVATPNHISKVKDIGFDIFEDIVDQSYNLEIDPFIYKQKFFSELERFTRNYPTIDDIQKLRDSIYPRLEDNYNMLKRYVNEDPYDWDNLLLNPY